MHKFEPTDHTQHLAGLLSQLYQLEDAVKAGDREKISRLVMDMDWPSVTDEFELVVAQHCYSVQYYALRLIRNLLHPYIQSHDCLRLVRDMGLLEQVLSESPSLHADADSEVAATWKHQLENAALRHIPVRTMPAIGTLNGLREAVSAKAALGKELEGRHPAFDAGERVPYLELVPSIPSAFGE
ncbi:MAG: hypothetical protein ACM31P_13385 [Actinomycetota bacterium]